MIGVIDAARPPRRGLRGPESIREVCLVGRPPGAWSPGDRVAWSGRPYRVVGVAPGPGSGSAHAHLRPEAGPSG